ncbi:MAG: hypothetical protein GX811_09780 [Lentisphaerae bacterium]|jgi:hypothetical protein|nr:hypothetical protein [Lentisphaerota bacterium]
MAKRKRNKFKQRKEVKIPLPCTLLIVVLAALATVHICLEKQYRELGDKTQKMEQKKESLDKLHDEELRKWANAKTPANIEIALKQHNLNMNFPEEKRIVRLYHSNARPGHTAGELAKVETKNNNHY